MLAVRVPAEPSRHRVAVWRELRRIGAVSRGQGCWAVPDAPVFADGVARVIALAARGEGDKEIRTAKFTMAELEEEEQILERLRGWYRDIKARDIFAAPTATEAETRLKHCAERLADYTEQVFTAPAPDVTGAPRSAGARR